MYKRQAPDRAIIVESESFQTFSQLFAPIKSVHEKVAKKGCKLSLFSQLSAPIKSGVIVFYFFCFATHHSHLLFCVVILVIFSFFLKYTPMEVVPPAGMLVKITDDVLRVG